MEHIKIWSSLMSLFTVVAMCLCWMHFERVDAANASLQEARLQFEHTRSELSSKKQRIDSRASKQQENEAANATLREAAASVAAIESMIKDAESKEASVRAGIKSAQEALAIALESKRSQAMSKNYPELLLRNGKSYTAVKIHKVDEDSIRFTHSAGTITAEAWLLPEEIQRDLDLGPNTVSVQLKELATSIEDKPEPETTQLPISNESPPKMLTENDKQNLIVMKAELADMEARIRSAVANRSHYAETASRSAIDASNAMTRGVPSTNFRIAAQNASASAAQCTTYISNAEAECRKLRERIYILQSMAR